MTFSGEILVLSKELEFLHCTFQFSDRTFLCIFRLKFLREKTAKKVSSCSIPLHVLCTLRYFVLIFLGNKVQTSQKNTGECLTS